MRLLQDGEKVCGGYLRANARSLRYLTVSIIFNVGATILAALASAKVWSPYTAAMAAGASAVATATSGYYATVKDRIVHGEACAAALRALEVGLEYGHRDPDEVEKDYEGMLKQYPQILCYMPGAGI